MVAITHLVGLTNIENIENIGKELDKYSKHYHKFILVTDFSPEKSEPCLSQFLYECNAKNIAKENLTLKMH